MTITMHCGCKIFSVGGRRICRLLLGNYAVQKDIMSVKCPRPGVSFTSGTARVGCKMQPIRAFLSIDAKRTLQWRWFVKITALGVVQENRSRAHGEAFASRA